MRWDISCKKFVTGLTALLLAYPCLAQAEQKMPSGNISQPMVFDNVPEQAKANTNWKSAKATGKQAQIVFMSVSTATNPKNEIGMETHEFDQVILIVDGNAKVDLNGKTQNVKAQDMIFIPLGTPHNVINLNANKALKLISVYSQTDIPAGSELKTK